MVWWWFSHSAVFDSCNPMDCSPPDSPVHGIFQARILQGLPFPSPADLPDPRIATKEAYGNVMVNKTRQKPAVMEFTA